MDQKVIKLIDKYISSLINKELDSQIEKKAEIISSYNEAVLALENGKEYVKDQDGKRLREQKEEGKTNRIPGFKKINLTAERTKHYTHYIKSNEQAVGCALDAQNKLKAKRIKLEGDYAQLIKYVLEKIVNSIFDKSVGSISAGRKHIHPKTIIESLKNTQYYDALKDLPAVLELPAEFQKQKLAKSVKGEKAAAPEEKKEQHQANGTGKKAASKKKKEKEPAAKKEIPAEKTSKKVLFGNFIKALFEVFMKDHHQEYAAVVKTKKTTKEPAEGAKEKSSKKKKSTTKEEDSGKKAAKEVKEPKDSSEEKKSAAISLKPSAKSYINLILQQFLNSFASRIMLFSALNEGKTKVPIGIVSFVLTEMIADFNTLPKISVLVSTDKTKNKPDPYKKKKALEKLKEEKVKYMKEKGVEKLSEEEEKRFELQENSITSIPETQVRICSAFPGKTGIVDEIQKLFINEGKIKKQKKPAKS